MTALENLMEAPLAHGQMSKGEIGLGSKLDAILKTYQGVSNKGVAIARSMMMDPKILCLR